MLSPRLPKIGGDTYCSTRAVGVYPLARVSWRPPRGFRAQAICLLGCVAGVLAFKSRLSILETYFWMKTTAPVSWAAESQSWNGEIDLRACVSWRPLAGLP
jgi:hypothetical protein